MPDQGKKALIVDGDAEFRERLRQLLSRSALLRSVEASDDTSNLFDVVRETGVEIVLLSADLGGMDAADITRALSAARPRVRVVALKGLNGKSAEAVQRMLRAGAMGVLDKALPEGRLLGVVERMVQTNGAMPAAGGYVEWSTQTTGQIESRLGTLSPRERQVLELVANGMTSREVAERLGIKARTVEVHRHHILRKLAVRGIADLVKFAIRAGVTSI